MIIKHLGSVDLALIDEFLIKAQKKRAHSPHRETDIDTLYIFEPKEVFSITKFDRCQRDLFFIHNKEGFERYREEYDIPIIVTKRGGGMFWHGPGQLCAAPLLDIKRLKFDPTDYSSLLEDICIETLAYFNVYGIRNHYPNYLTGKIEHGSYGVWIARDNGHDLRKIAFLGWSDKDGIAIHGCAINVSCSLYPFSLIHPCNLKGIRATSVQEITGTAFPVTDVAKKFIAIFSKKIEDLQKIK